MFTMKTLLIVITGLFLSQTDLSFSENTVSNSSSSFSSSSFDNNNNVQDNVNSDNTGDYNNDKNSYNSLKPYELILVDPYNGGYGGIVEIDEGPYFTEPVYRILLKQNAELIGTGAALFSNLFADYIDMFMNQLDGTETSRQE